MGCCRWTLLLLSTCIALQAMLGSSQVPGFLSIDCGSDSTTIYTDQNGIEWTGDSNLITEGTPIPISGGTDPLLSTMRLFDGNQSKYCYSLTDNAIKEGAFFMVRGSFWGGITPPYIPQNPDGNFRFTLIVDADVWYEVKISSGNTQWWIYETYMRAQRNSIDVCFARSTPGGDAPFISALELRLLPPTLTSTYIMLNSSRIFTPLGHTDYGVLSTTSSVIRYPQDPLDRYWLSSSLSPVITTVSDIRTSDQLDKPPPGILQTALTKDVITLTFTNLNPDLKYFAEFYFAEIDPAVNGSGQRVFDIYANGILATTSGSVDVFAEVGANAAYAYPIVAIPNAAGGLTFNFTSTGTTSVFQPYVAAGELFSTKILTTLTDSTTVSAVDDIKASMNLNSYKGDPCFPIGFGYQWLNCSQAPNITSISLSNYSTQGEIPKSLNVLTTLTEIYLDGNGLQGVIPDLSALTDLQILVLSNNDLTGPIPDYLATLKNLKVLSLQNNKLSGEIPAALLQRKQASTLNFEFSGNPLCETNSELNCTSSSPPGSTSPSNAPPPSADSKKKGSSGVIIGVVVAVILVVGIGIGIAVYCICKNRTPSSLEQPINSQQELPAVYPSPGPVIRKDVIPKLSVQEFSFKEIKVATNNFSTQLGMGGFGPVYKGRLQDGRFVAIKVASNSSHQGSKEFLNEVDLLSRVHHKNLVGLLGYCNEEKLVLVYEFMSNGSLFDCLHGAYSKASPLSWGTRLRILVDAAQGFDYLHYGCNPRIIHRDVKSSNILLNDQLEAKISDFGISRNSFINETGAPPTALMGSMGYMDPEYLSTMKLTEKVDVYSFGVLLFEVVCGRTAVFTDSSTQQQTHIVEWSRSSIERGVIDDIVDASLHRQYDVSSVWKVLEIALACVNFSSSQRPKMNAVFLELKEAERMELESDQRNVFDKPSVEFNAGNEYNPLSFTHVNAR